MMFCLRNLTVVEIVPSHFVVTMNWNRYDTVTENALKVGYEEILVSDSKKTFLVTDKECGNNQFLVNGVQYFFDANNQHLIIDFNNGIKITPGVNYAAAKHVYDTDVFAAEYEKIR